MCGIWCICVIQYGVGNCVPYVNKVKLYDIHREYHHWIEEGEGEKTSQIAIRKENSSMILRAQTVYLCSNIKCYIFSTFGNLFCKMWHNCQAFDTWTKKSRQNSNNNENSLINKRKTRNSKLFLMDDGTQTKIMIIIIHNSVICLRVPLFVPFFKCLHKMPFKFKKNMEKKNDKPILHNIRIAAVHQKLYTIYSICVVPRFFSLSLTLLLLLFL